MGLYECISIEKAYELITEQESYVIDVREQRDYQAGHIEKAIHATEKNMQTLIRKGDRDLPVIVYCYHGHASRNAAEFIAQFGFAQVYSLDGGYEQWHKRYNLPRATKKSEGIGGMELSAASCD